MHLDNHISCLLERFIKGMATTEKRNNTYKERAIIMFIENRTLPHIYIYRMAHLRKWGWGMEGDKPNIHKEHVNLSSC